MKRTLFIAAGFATALSSATVAQDAFESQHEARHGVMAIMGISMGVLGGMARGRMDYDAEKAQTAANSILGVSMVDFLGFFPEGSDEMSMDNTRATVAIWENAAGFTAEWAKVQMAAPALAEAAGQGKDAMVAALGDVGGTCRSCHKAYRAPE